MDKLQSALTRFMNGYFEAKKNKDGNYAKFLTKEIPDLLQDCGIFDSEKYRVKASRGQGLWAAVPWIAIFDNEETDSALRGIYIVYLLSTDQKRLYLTINQGSDAYNGRRPREKAERLLKTAEHFSSKVDSNIFSKGLIDLGNPPLNSKNYENGTIFYKQYEQNDIPEDKELLSDLIEAKRIYSEILEIKNNEVTTSETLLTEDGTFFNYLRDKHLYYSTKTIENFLLSLKAKPFVILSGGTGTGKTRLAQEYGKYISKPTSNCEACEIEVTLNKADTNNGFTLDSEEFFSKLPYDGKKAEGEYRIKIGDLDTVCTIKMSPRLWYRPNKEKVIEEIVKLKEQGKDKAILKVFPPEGSSSGCN